MPFDVRQFRNPGQCWVVKTCDGAGISGHVVTTSESDHADLSITNHHRQVVAISNAVIESIKVGHVIRMAGWYCFFGYTAGDRTIDIWCEHGVTQCRLIYSAGQGLSPRPTATPTRPHDLPDFTMPMSEMVHAHIHLVVSTLVEPKSEPCTPR